MWLYIDGRGSSGDLLINGWCEFRAVRADPEYLSAGGTDGSTASSPDVLCVSGRCNVYSTFQSLGWCRLLDSQCGLKEITFVFICTSSVPHSSLAGFKNAVSSRYNGTKCMAFKKKKNKAKKTCYLLLCHAVFQRTHPTTQWIQGCYARAKHPKRKKKQKKNKRTNQRTAQEKHWALMLEDVQFLWDERSLHVCVWLRYGIPSCQITHTSIRVENSLLLIFFFFFFYKGCVALNALPSFYCQTSGSLTSRLVCAVVN